MRLFGYSFLEIYYAIVSRAFHRTNDEKASAFPSQSEAIIRIQKDFITLLKNYSSKRLVLSKVESVWKYSEINFEKDMYKIAYNYLNRWNGSKLRIVNEMNLLARKSLFNSNELKGFSHSSSIIPSDLEVFVLKNQLLEKRKVSSWYQAYRTVIRQFEEMKAHNEFWTDQNRTPIQRRKELKHQKTVSKIWNLISDGKENGSYHSVSEVCTLLNIHKVSAMLILRKWLQLKLVEKRRINQASYNRTIDFGIKKKAKEFPFFPVY